ncbi:Outer membrane protein beta-barrel domain-containing protein [Mesonia phycicola]|uniref:Outer membrane protein beta-barrel domain-containing protein n=1 Tax=Mesonia phycicola TaxID=579105 RepID=A0A1M6GLD5_9FLAO|nr:outer membrane beta-barrel protein [Mesonia phycicola]SHJ10760.1 Outer membrane protein beta-barrel domain-containing protein [Mesonia phycicola]
MEPNNNWKNKFNNPDKNFVPSDKVWDSIDQTISYRRKKKRFVFLLLFVGLFSIISIGGYTTFVNSDKVKITNNKNNTSNTNKTTPNEVNDSSNKSLHENEKITHKNHNNKDSIKLVNNNKKSLFKSENTIGFKSKKTDNHKIASVNKQEESYYSKKHNQPITKPINSSHISFASNKDSFISCQLNPLGLEFYKFDISGELLKRKSKKNKNQVKEQFITWGIKPVAGINILKPPYKNHPLEANNPNYKQNIKIGYSYGFQISAEVTPKLWVYTGLTVNHYKYDIKNISIDEQEPLSLEKFININTNTFISQQMLNNFANGTNQLDLQYKLEFYEIPLMASYNILNKRNKKLKLNAEAGFSFFFQKNNSINLTNQEQTLPAGELNFLNKNPFSIQTGLLSTYPLNNNFSIEAGSLFKYHFNLLNNVNTYSINLQLGIKYKFDY